MKTFLSLVIVSACSWVGWELGSPFGLMTAYLLSSLTSLGGVVLAWKLHRKLGE